MKKLIFCLLLFAVILPAAWTQTVPVLGTGIFTSEFVGPESITFFSDSSSDTTDKAIGVVLNLVIPGLGCFVIGDTTGGLISLIGVLGSSAVVGAGYGIYVNAAVTRGVVSPLGVTFMIAGGISTLVFEIYNIVRPIRYVNRR